jgi:hypothetical protein
MLFTVMFFHCLAFRGGERARRIGTVIKAVDFDLVGWVGGDLVSLAGEGWSGLIAFSSIAGELDLTAFGEGWFGFKHDREFSGLVFEFKEAIIIGLVFFLSGFDPGGENTGDFDWLI